MSETPTTSSLEPLSLPVTWDHVYLLGWYAENGRANLTSWDGNAPMIDVVVVGLHGRRVPVWNAPVPDGAQLVRVPEDADPQEFAREHGGLHAFGWHLSSPIGRTS
jgi:hypothetical protein